MKAKISLRVYLPHWINSERRADVRALLTRHPGVIDEVALFPSITPTPIRLDLLEERAGALRDAIQEFRTTGLSVGINHLATLGHRPGSRELSVVGSLPVSVDAAGKASEGSLCPTAPAVRAFIAESYRILARTGPDFIWVDDDTRLHGHSDDGHDCFCENCLAAFSRETQTAWTLPGLKEALDGQKNPDAMALRRQWLAHNRQVMTDLFTAIRRAVDDVDKSIIVGYMSADNYYSGHDFEQWSGALSRNGQISTMWRPGGGYYEDWIGINLLYDKVHDLGRQVADLPESVRDIQSEIETYPHLRLQKSTRILTHEIGAYIAAGCTGAALAILGITEDPFEENADYFDAIGRHRAFYDRAVEAFGRSPCEGVWTAINKDYLAGLNSDGNWFEVRHHQAPRKTMDLAFLGLPVAYGQAGAAVCALTGESVPSLTDEQIVEVFSGGVLCEAEALPHLERRGLLGLAGFRVRDRRLINDTVERYTPDALNGRYAGWRRNCQYGPAVHVVDPLDDRGRILSEALDYSDGAHGALSGVYENDRGGRVAVCGHCPWTHLYSRVKADTLKSLILWLSKDRLAAYVASFHRVHLWVRRDAHGRPALFLVNSSYDTITDVEVCICRSKGHIGLERENGESEVLPMHSVQDSYGRYQIASMAPWEMALLTSPVP